LAMASERDSCFSVPESMCTAHTRAPTNRHGLNAVHGEDVPCDLNVLLDLDPDCGAQTHPALPACNFDLDSTTPLARLDALGWSVSAEGHGLLWEFDLNRTDRGIAIRPDQCGDTSGPTSGQSAQ
jgi:hypothetical protein